MCQSSLKRYAKLQKFTLIEEHSYSVEGIKYQERHISFYDTERQDTIRIVEKIIGTADDIYVLSGQLHTCPLISVYESMLDDIFKSVTIRSLVS